MKLPAIHLYPGDWLRDAVAGCSLAAQGLWLRMMFLMHDSERYGYLVVNGSPMSSESIARRCGCTPAEYETLLTELDAAGVPSRTKDNLIFSRRMVRDADERQKNAERQKRFRNNGKSNADSNARVTDDSQESNNASSMSSSDSVTNVTGAKPPNVIWDLGVPLLTNGGMKEAEARSLLGKMAKDHSRAALAEAIAKTSAANPPDPKAYLVKVLQSSNSTKERGVVV
jgi:hypothetical protein